MATLTFYFSTNPGYTPTCTLRRADTGAVLGAPTAAQVRYAGAQAAVKVDINVGAYTGPVIMETTAPAGIYYGDTSLQFLANEPPAAPTTGSGTYALTATVRTAAATAVPGAVVTVRQGGLQVAWGLTGAGGVVVFHLVAGTYDVDVQSTPGYTPDAPHTVAVAAAASVALVLTPTALVPPTAGTVVGLWVAYNEVGVEEAGVAVTVKLVQAPANMAGHAYDSKLRTLTSTGGGLVQVPGMHPGATYNVQRGTGPLHKVLVPADAVGTVNLADIIGLEA